MENAFVYEGLNVKTMENLMYATARWSICPSGPMAFCFTPSQRKTKKERKPRRSLRLCGKIHIKDPFRVQFKPPF